METQIYARNTPPRGAEHSVGHKSAAVQGQEEQASHNIKIMMHMKNTTDKNTQYSGFQKKCVA
jgi:hypothetical protein